jgi:hypothetical protein
MPGRIVRVQNQCFDLVRAELKHARFTVIDPDRRMIMFRHGISPSAGHAAMTAGLPSDAEIIQFALNNASSSGEFRYAPDIGSIQHRWS